MNALFNVHEPGITDWLVGSSDDFQRIVIQTPVDGSEPVEWRSAAAANKALRICKGAISRAIRNKSVAAGSYWAMKSEINK